MDITIKVTAAGAIACYRGKTRLHRIWEESPIASGPQRKALQSDLDPVLLRATRLLFGPVFKPADYNEVHQHRALVNQVMADNPKVLVPLYGFVQKCHLTATPLHSVVRRFKGLLQRERVQAFKLAPGGGFYPNLDAKGKKRRSTEVNRFWSSANDMALPVFTDAGWRYLQKFSASSQRELSKLPWQWRSRYLHILSLMGKLGLPAVNTAAIEIVEMGYVSCEDDRSREVFARAVAERFTRGEEPPVDAEVAVLRDWFYEGSRIVNSGTRFETIIARAFEEAGLSPDKLPKQVKDYVWTPPIEPFVAAEGMTVLPLSNGLQLLEEGIEMDNCLRNRDSYAKRAVQGVSQVFSVRGVQGRASVEFVRSSRDDAWHFGQMEGPAAAEVVNPVIHRVVAQIQNTLQGVS